MDKNKFLTFCSFHFSSIMKKKAYLLIAFELCCLLFFFSPSLFFLIWFPFKLESDNSLDPILEIISLVSHVNIISMITFLKNASKNVSIYIYNQLLIIIIIIINIIIFISKLTWIALLLLLLFFWILLVVMNVYGRLKAYLKNKRVYN